jgi:hypothetical protein
VIPSTEEIGLKMLNETLKWAMEMYKKPLAEFSKDLQVAFGNVLDQYLKLSYERYSYFNSLVFSNQKRKLKDYYEPLTLRSGENANEAYTINTFPAQLLESDRAVLIVDTAGMGKSTITKYLFLTAIESGKNIPVNVELRRLSQEKSLVDYIHSQLNVGEVENNSEIIFRLFKDGGFLFLLDGYDEIGDSDRTKVTEEIVEFVQRYGQNQFVLTSRNQTTLSALGNFKRYSIDPLSFSQAESLIRKFGQGSDITKVLLEKINEEEAKPIHEFLKNPLLVTLLFKAFEYKPTLPFKQHIFYRQVFEALYESHDLSKETGGFSRSKVSGLDIYSFDLVLRTLAFQTLSQSKIEFTKDELIRQLTSVKAELTSIDFNPISFIQDLVSNVPLFIDEVQTIRWNHKSLQEYFSALYLSSGGKDLQRQVLRSIYRSERFESYQNFLALFSDIEPQGFRHTISLNFLKDVRDEYDKFYSVMPKSLNAQALLNRFQLISFRSFVIFSMDEETLKDFRHPPKDRSKSNFLRNEITKVVEFSMGLNGVKNRGWHFAAEPVTVLKLICPDWNRASIICRMTPLRNLGFKIEKSKITINSSTEQHSSLFDNNASTPELLPRPGYYFLDSTMPCALDDETEFSFEAVNKLISMSEPFLIFDINLVRSEIGSIESEVLTSDTRTFEF